MDHKYIEDNHVAQSYLMGKLSPEEKERFEQHYLECDECLDQLRLAECLHRGLKAVAVEEMVARAAGSAVAVSWWHRLGRWGRMSLAVLVLVVVVVPFATRSFRTPQISEPVAETQLVLLSSTRSSSNEIAPETRITRIAGSKYYTISLDLVDPEHDQYQIRLLDGTGRSLWQSKSVQPDEMGALVLILPVSFLPAGEYSFEVAAIPADDDTTVASFPFLVLE